VTQIKKIFKEHNCYHKTVRKNVKKIMKHMQHTKKNQRTAEASTENKVKSWFKTYIIEEAPVHKRNFE